MDKCRRVRWYASRLAVYLLVLTATDRWRKANATVEETRHVDVAGEGRLLQVSARSSRSELDTAYQGRQQE